MGSVYGYFPGCSLRGTGVAYEQSLLELFRVLGLPLEELRDWNCCGASAYMSIDESSAFVVSARNLALAHRSGRQDLVAPCSACYLVLRKTQDYVARYPSIARRVNTALRQANLGVLNSVHVRHPLEVLFTDVGPATIKSKTVRRWKPGPLACYYGCQLVRPYGEADRSEDPVRMDELLHAAGVPTVEWALKTKCCGGSLTGTTHEVGLRLNEILLKEAARKGAVGIAVACPLCQYNLDAYQSELRKNDRRRPEMPVLYFTQILGWALGGEPEALGLQRSISGRKLIAEWFAAQPAEAVCHA